LFVSYDDDLIIKRFEVVRDPNDLTWSNPEVTFSLSSGSLTYSIEDVLIYACGKDDPVQCIQRQPVHLSAPVTSHSFGWRDVSERQGSSIYPQVANFLIIIKITGPNGRTGWVGSWDTVHRTDYNIFNPRSHEISDIDFYASSSDLILPIKAYIQGFKMIPFNWAEKLVFQGASSLFGLGADESDLQSSSPQFQAAQPQNNEITGINKDFYFVHSATSSGISIPYTLTLNPSFACGDNRCEPNLGETTETCCYDCLCDAGEYCDVISPATKIGGCKDLDDISIDIQPLTIPTVTDCALPFSASVKVDVSNMPTNPSETYDAYMELGNDVYS